MKRPAHAPPPAPRRRQFPARRQKKRATTPTHRIPERYLTDDPMSHLTNRDSSEPARPTSDAPSVDSVSGFSMSELSMDPLQDPLWNDEEPDARAEPVDPELLARRRQFRSWVARGMGGLALFTIAALLAHGVGQRTTSQADRTSAVASEPQLPSATTLALPAPVIEPSQPAAPAVAAAPSAVVAPSGETLRDIGLPPVANRAGLARWASLASSATVEEFADVDARLAKLVKSRTASIRDRARLARAILWRERGRGADVRAVFDDLALHSKSRDVRAAARTNQTH